MILAGDIGGTKTVLALFEEVGHQLHLVRDATFKSQEHPSLEALLATFLQQAEKPALQAGCFGVAGAVIEGRSRLTNLPWQIDEHALAQPLGTLRVRLLNDLETAAYGMLYLGADELEVLNPGNRPRLRGNVVVIAAGTGLGEAILYWDGRQHHPLASEGGHCDFAPRTDQEIELLRYLRARFGNHVSYERVLSGPGFYHVYCFLRDSGYAPQTREMAELLRSGDPSVTITQHGLAGTDPLSVATLDLFSSIYGAETGNLALKCVALGGVFVGGGIAPKILPALKKGGFVRAFCDKGRFASLLQGVEVSVALNPRAPLLGAAHYALRL